jgi:DNA (cytosine-5)-methyltransferase 1
MIRFADLFAGIGGLRLGFEEACKTSGIQNRCVFSSEINSQACETYKLNFNEKPSGDIYSIKHIPDFDFLLAGFPCQSFSYAGKHQGFGDTRGTLFFEVERILREKKPNSILLENVRGLTTHDKGKTFKTILSTLEKLDYGVKYLLLNSSNFNVPQNRVRLYIIGTLNKQPILSLSSDVGAADSHKFKLMTKQQSLFDYQRPKMLVKDILEKNPDKKYNCSPKFVRLLSKAVGSNYISLNGVRLIDYRNGNSMHSWQLGIKGDCIPEEIQFMNALISNRRKKIFGKHQDGKKLTMKQIQTFYDKPNMFETINSLMKKGYLSQDESSRYNPVCGNMSFEIFKFLDPESISITLTSSDCHKLGVVQNNFPRHITPRECARLQGFPDTFKCHSDDRYAYKQFGNSVSVPVVKEIILNFFRNNNDFLSSYSDVERLPTEYVG